MKEKKCIFHHSVRYLFGGKISNCKGKKYDYLGKYIALGRNVDDLVEQEHVDNVGPCRRHHSHKKLIFHITGIFKFARTEIFVIWRKKTIVPSRAGEPANFSIGSLRLRLLIFPQAAPAPVPFIFFIVHLNRMCWLPFLVLLTGSNALYFSLVRLEMCATVPRVPNRK